jgi:hypothetical protein
MFTVHSHTDHVRRAICACIHRRGELTMNREHEQDIALLYLQLLLRAPDAHLLPANEIQELLEAINANREPGLSIEPRAA